MDNRISRAVSAPEWPLVYLTGTVLSIGLVVGVRAAFPELAPPSGLVAAGVVVGLYTAISVFYYYTSVTRTPSSAVPADEL